MIIDPDNSDVLLAATNLGIYRTIDAGLTWTLVISGNFYDVIANPTSTTNIFYASNATNIFKSTNNGASFSSVHSMSGSGRINLAVTPANDTYVYGVSTNASTSGFNSLVRSTNSGNSFTSRSTTPNILGFNQTGNDSGGQGWYDLCIAVDPTNANTVYVGGINIWKSTNGGSNWTLNTFWYNISGKPTVHADKHVFVWQNNTTLWNGNDGGIYKTTNGGSSWTDKTNTLAHSQIYRIGASQSDSKVIAGLQDNGTKLKSATNTWSDALGGDGMECNIHPNNSNIQYGCIQSGALQRTTNNWINSTDIRNNISTNLEGAWITPHVIDPTTPSTIYAAYESLYKSTNQGDSWTTIGTAAQIGTGNKTLLQVAPSNSNVIYVGTSTSIYRTQNGGTTWAALNLPGSDISSIAVHPTEPLTLWVTRANYLAGKKVYRSFDGGQTWTNITGTLPNLPVNVVIHNNQLAESLYIGMDVGVFYINHDLNDWVLFSDNLPNVEIFDLNINYNSNTIYAGTYGRGLWSSDLYSPDPTPCNAVYNASVTPGYQSVYVTWLPFNPSLSSSYEIAISTTATPPISGLFTTETQYFISGLNNDTDYFVHIRAKCSNASFSIWKTFSFKTPASCGYVYVDSGGTNGNYSDNEDITTTICPPATNGNGRVTATFTNFNVETNYDALYVYNGSNSNASLIASSNGVTGSGFPAGGYYGSTAPGPFTSTSTDGCLTMRFRSDYIYNFSGFITPPISCSNGCSNVVTALGNTGINTLRDEVSCNSSGSHIFFDASLSNQSIVLSTPIVINKNLTISGSFSSPTKLSASGANGIFEIGPGYTVTLENLEITPSSDNIDAIINSGNLILRNVTIKDAESTLGNSILNNGALTIKDNVLITNE